MNKVVDILMKRDNMTKEEALKAVIACARSIEYLIAEDNFEEAEDCLLNDLGVEPDYLLDVLSVRGWWC